MMVRLAGLILMLLLTPVAILGWLHLVARGLLFADTRAREMLGALDTFGNAAVFGGSRIETISSHAGREARRGTWWAVWVCAGLDVLQKGHCEGANALEQPLLDAVERYKH